MSAPTGGQPERLLSYDFVVLTLAAGFGFCNIAVFYGLASHLEHLGVDPAWRGTIIAAEPLAALLTRPFLSVWLTARQALVLARLSLVAIGAALPCYLYAETIPALLAVRVFHGLAFVCLVSAVVTLLSKVVPPRLAGRAFGLFSLSSLVPYAIMPPLTEWLLARVGGEAQAYAWTALLTLPSLAMFVPLGSRLGQAAFPATDTRRPTMREFRENLAQNPVVLLLAANMLVFAGTTQVFFFIKPYALGLGIADPGLFFTVSTAASIAARLLAGPFLDSVPRRGTAMLAILVVSACMALFARAGGEASLFCLAGAYGFSLGIALPLLNASMFLESPPPLRGMNMNLMLFMMDAGYTFGPLVGGLLLAGTGGFGSLFGVSAGFACVAAALIALLALGEWRRRGLAGG
ncbi:MFS transporter [Fundidesulfovibrio agrisoli]|uniref:MFS transporter n=1 Tax=Fundidesulfovibrio agrisoli TaxID=2922717 RepID=UPI001FAE028D|nr:MFS transporter [Fundidesulfovibrio agrisoli]